MWYQTVPNTQVGEGWNLKIVELLKKGGVYGELYSNFVVDLGCAEGFFLANARDRGAAKVLGFDNNAEMISRVESWIVRTDQMHYYQRDIESEKFRNIFTKRRKFHLIYVLDVLHQLLQPGELLQLCAMRLSIKHGMIVTNGYVQNEDRKQRPGLLKYHFSIQYISKLLLGYGLGEVRDLGEYRPGRHLIVGLR